MLQTRQIHTLLFTHWLGFHYITEVVCTTTDFNPYLVVCPLAELFTLGLNWRADTRGNTGKWVNAVGRRQSSQLCVKARMKRWLNPHTTTRLGSDPDPKIGRLSK